MKDPLPVGRPEPWTSKSTTLTESNPLPGDNTIWEHCSLGHFFEWPDSLQAYCLTVSAFRYPAAVFWGEEFLLLHNDQWSRINGTEQQGKNQRGKLSADAWNILNSTYHGGAPKKLASNLLLRADTSSEEYSVLLSPLFNDSSSEGAAGVLAQLIPKTKISNNKQRRQPTETGPIAVPSPNHGQLDPNGVEDAVDDVPLDEHPFFHRFAEMLPTGLAILDHEAKAVFV